MPVTAHVESIGLSGALANRLGRALGPQAASEPGTMAAELRRARRMFKDGLALVDECLRRLDAQAAAAEEAPAEPQADDVAEFMASCTAKGPPGAFLQGQELHDVHAAWCHVHGRPVRSVTAFGRRLVELGYPKVRNGRVLYLGLQLSEEGRRIARAAGVRVFLNAGLPP